MLNLLPALLPWWLSGPGLGLCVAALYGLANRSLGVSGGWLAAVVGPAGGLARGTPAGRVPGRHDRRRAGRGRAGLGHPAHRISGAVQDRARRGAVPAARGGGLALGYGARQAGGCTSGHGLSGCAAGSPDSLAATATFFAVAAAVTVTVHALTGGAL